MEVGRRVETIQTTALLRTARILRRVLETWGDLLSLRLQWKNHQLTLMWKITLMSKNNNIKYHQYWNATNLDITSKNFNPQNTSQQNYVNEKKLTIKQQQKLHPILILKNWHQHRIKENIPINFYWLFFLISVTVKIIFRFWNILAQYSRFSLLYVMSLKPSDFPKGERSFQCF